MNRMAMILLYSFCHISQREDIIKLIKEICGKTIYRFNHLCKIKKVVLVT